MVTDDIATPTDRKSSPCAFDKPIIHRWFSCAKANRTHVAEGEVVTCCEVACARRCASYFSAVLSRGRFLNHGELVAATMPYSQLTRFQLGAVRALCSILGVEDVDIDTLVGKTVQRYRSIEDLPYSAIIREIAATRMRRRSPGS
ncbi:MAG: hypothetical protein DWQ08_05180 [Proteobacteria bacterium]|nr:MAG: hypothetical protein DWQ08_05180 [Pseudomonadota bacterium]